MKIAGHLIHWRNNSRQRSEEAVGSDSYELVTKKSVVRNTHSEAHPGVDPDENKNF